MDWKKLVAEVTPVTRSVWVMIDGDLGSRLDRLEADLQQALRDDERENRKPEAPRIAEQIEQLREQAPRREFTFRSVGDAAWRDLIGKHPPKKGGQLDHDPVTFQPAAMAASCVTFMGEETDGVPVEAFEALNVSLSSGQWHRLWMCCLAVNVEADDLPKSVTASVVLDHYASSSTTARNGESPTASS